jgi:Tol biopolymer transport system component
VVVTALQRRQNLWETALPAAGAGGRWLSRGSSVDRQPVYSPDGGRVAFASTRGGNLDLWSLDLVSGEVHRLTDHPAEDWDPAFTPDGRHLLWSSNRSGHFEVWIAEPDGSSPRQLSRDGFDAENPTASADGWVSYASSHPERGGIWRLRQDGGDAQRLVAGVENQHPELSPDGAWVLYHLRRGGFEELHAARTADGAALPLLSIPLGHPRSARVLNELDVAVGRARWRPDGRAVLYVGFDAEGRAGIFELPVPPLAEGRAAAQPRPVLLSAEEANTETFALTGDGRRLVVSFREQAQNLMLAEGVPGVGGSKRE